MIHIKNSYQGLSRNALVKSVLAVFIVLTITSCNRYVFAPGGFIVDGDPTYYNDSMKFAVALSGDHQNFRREHKTGFRVNKLLQRKDRRVLKRVNFDKKESTILFSGKPIFEPFYNLIAYIKTGEDIGVDTSDYEIGYVDHRLAYYFKVGMAGKIHIAHSILPVDGGFLNLVHYQSEPEYLFCQNCDFLEISERNAKRIQKGELYTLAYSNCDCVKEANENVIRISADSLIKNEHSLIKVYKRPIKEFVCFKLLNGNETDFLLSLREGNYVIEHTDLKNKKEWSKEVTVK